MNVGKLEVYVGGMFAEKSTSLIRQGKRHMIAGEEVVFLKPQIDNRYGEDVVCTHAGIKASAYPVWFDNAHNEMANILAWIDIKEADVVCIDEVQFFPPVLLDVIDNLIYSGKKVYCAGLDLDKNGKPFGIVPFLMAKAEAVHKLQAVCADCGADAWVSVETVKMEGKVNVGNDYKPVCRSCSVEYMQGKVLVREYEETE